MSASELILQFKPETFLRQLKVDDVAEAFRTGKWRKLYRRFLDSPHFYPWFGQKQSQCITELNGMLKMMRLNADHLSLTHDIGGARLGTKALDELQSKIQAAIQQEIQELDADKNYVYLMQTHLEFVKNAARTTGT